MSRHPRDDLSEAGPSFANDMLALSEADVSERGPRKRGSSPLPVIVGVGAVLLVAGASFVLLTSGEPTADVPQPLEAPPATAVVLPVAPKPPSPKVEEKKVEPPPKAEKIEKKKKSRKKRSRRRVDQRERALDAALEKVNLGAPDQ